MARESGNPNELRMSPGWAPAEPLWKRVPTRGSDGRPLSDFMMIIPKLRTRPQSHVADVVQQIESVLHHYHDVVVFADLNLRLNVLWVTIKPVTGMCMEIPTAIKARVPDAVLVAHRPEY